MFYCITQHLHFGFFLIITCSTCDASLGCTTVPLCMSTVPGDGFVSFVTVFPLALCWLLLSFLSDGDFGLCDRSLMAFFVMTSDGDSLAVSVSSFNGSFGDVFPGVGVIGLPSFISSTISSASRLRSPPGRNGFSQPLSVLKK